jgi:hypothetical protein
MRMYKQRKCYRNATGNKTIRHKERAEQFFGMMDVGKNLIFSNVSGMFVTFLNQDLSLYFSAYFPIFKK